MNSGLQYIRIKHDYDRNSSNIQYSRKYDFSSNKFRFVSCILQM